MENYPGMISHEMTTYLVLIEDKIFRKNIGVAETLEHGIHETANRKLIISFS